MRASASDSELRISSCKSIPGVDETLWEALLHQLICKSTESAASLNSGYLSPPHVPSIQW